LVAKDLKRDTIYETFAFDEINRMQYWRMEKGLSNQNKTTTENLQKEMNPKKNTLLME
jgi:hypothetical protein